MGYESKRGKKPESKGKKKEEKRRRTKRRRKRTLEPPKPASPGGACTSREAYLMLPFTPMKLQKLKIDTNAPSPLLWLTFDPFDVAPAEKTKKLTAFQFRPHEEEEEEEEERGRAH